MNRYVRNRYRFSNWPNSLIDTKSVSREIERRVGTKTATFWARNRLNLRSTGIEYMYNAKYMYLGIAAASIQTYNPI